MKKSWIEVSVLILFLALFLLGLIFREVWGRPLAESILNQSMEEFFQGSLRLEKFQLDPQLKVTLGSLRGRVKQETGEIPFEIHEIASEGPLTRYFSPEGLSLQFIGLRLGDSARAGIRGKVKARGGEEGFLKLKVQVESLGLEELARFNPENLGGAQGEIKGEIVFRQDAKGNIELTALLRVESPGGELPSRFFEPLLAYLPEFAVRRDVRKLVAVRGLVGYREASLEIRSIQSDRIKIVLHLLVPEYNLDLNLNLEIRVDEKNAFADLAGLLGLLKMKSAE